MQLTGEKAQASRQFGVNVVKKRRVEKIKMPAAMAGIFQRGCTE
jgi:hypothetical protein